MLTKVIEETCTIMDTEKQDLGFTSDKENTPKIKREVDAKPEESNFNQNPEVKDTTKIIDGTEDVFESIMSNFIDLSSCSKKMKIMKMIQYFL